MVLALLALPCGHATEICIEVCISWHSQPWWVPSFICTNVGQRADQQLGFIENLNNRVACLT